MILFRICVIEYGFEMLIVEKDLVSFFNVLEVFCKYFLRNCIVIVESWGDYSKFCSFEDYFYNLMFLLSEFDIIIWFDGCVL